MLIWPEGTQWWSTVDAARSPMSPDPTVSAKTRLGKSKTEALAGPPICIRRCLIILDFKSAQCRFSWSLSQFHVRSLQALHSASPAIGSMWFSQHLQRPRAVPTWFSPNHQSPGLAVPESPRWTVVAPWHEESRTAYSKFKQNASLVALAYQFMMNLQVQICIPRTSGFLSTLGALSLLACLSKVYCTRRCTWVVARLLHRHQGYRKWSCNVMHLPLLWPTHFACRQRRCVLSDCSSPPEPQRSKQASAPRTCAWHSQENASSPFQLASPFSSWLSALPPCQKDHTSVGEKSEGSHQSLFLCTFLGLSPESMVSKIHYELLPRMARKWNSMNLKVLIAHSAKMIPHLLFLLESGCYEWHTR